MKSSSVDTLETINPKDNAKYFLKIDPSGEAWPNEESPKVSITVVN